MYFDTKSYLKSNRNFILKHARIPKKLGSPITGYCLFSVRWADLSGDRDPSKFEDVEHGKNAGAFPFQLQVWHFGRFGIILYTILFNCIITGSRINFF